jgi:hypothetical protein
VLATGVNGGLVALGYGGRTAPYAVLRGGAGDGELQPVTRVVPLELGVQQAPALVGEVISQARVVDVAPPRWDGQVARRGALRWAGVVLFGWVVLVRLLRREPAGQLPAVT